MRLKMFRARGMAEAIAKVRAELGEDALILNTRKVADGIEITAALETTTAEAPALPEPGRSAALAWHGVPPDLHAALERGNLEETIARTIAFGSIPLGPEERPVMLTGPPGGGKTMTTVRLAIRLVKRGAAPLVITTDGNRVGATEQLAAFTRLLGVPFLVAGDPVSLVRAMAQRRDGAPLLIDTAGADSRDPIQADELRDFAAAADAHVALVLPSGLDPAEAAEIAVAHAACGATSMIVTRLDIARRLGGVIAAAAASGLPLTEAGTGPGAADGLTPFTPSFLAARLGISEGRNNAT